MKRIKFSVLVLLASVFIGQSINAQSSFGIIGGATFNSTTIRETNLSMRTQYHAGLTYRAKLPLGFSIQPALIYNVKAAALEVENYEQIDLSTGYLELPISLQWGPDLILFRPFLDVTPFVGYGVDFKLKSEGQNTVEGWKQTALNRLEYGLGLGVGFEIWRIQVIGRYNWNFGALYSGQDDFSAEPYKDAVYDALHGNRHGTVTLSVALLFGKSRK